jgi:hypothetical protein
MMIHVKTQRVSNFTTVHNGFILDPKLSWRAKGLLLYLLSRPEEWTANIEHLLTVSDDGKTATCTGIKELQTRGYVTIAFIRDDKGQWTGANWVVRERAETGTSDHTPNHNNTVVPGLACAQTGARDVQTPALGPYPDSPDTDKPAPGNQPLLRTDVRKTNTVSQVIQPTLLAPETPPDSGTQSATTTDAKPKEQSKDKDPNDESSPVIAALATQLLNIVTAHRNIANPTAFLICAKSSIRCMVKRDVISPKEIHDMLEFYADVFGGEYIPVILCGKTLREKWVKLQSAYTREQAKGYVHHSNTTPEGAKRAESYW